MHVVRLLAPRLDNENHTKDIDFSPIGHPPALGSRLCRHGARAASGRPVARRFDPLEGVILHEPMPGSCDALRNNHLS